MGTSGRDEQASLIRSNGSTSSSHRRRSSQPKSGESLGHTHPGSALSSYLGLASTMIGSGVLVLPGATAALGMTPTLLLILCFAIFTFYTFEILRVVSDVTNLYSYESLSNKLFGPTGVWTVRVTTLLLVFGAMIVVIILGVDMLEPFLGDVMSRGTLGLVYTLLAVPLCLPETIYALRYSNAVAAVCLLYILLSLLIKSFSPIDVVTRSEYTQHQESKVTLDDPKVEFNSELAAFAYAVPIIAMAYCCQLNIPRAYDEIHDKSETTKVHIATAASGCLLNILFAVFGSLAFAGHPPSDLLTGFPPGDGVINAARICLAVTSLARLPMMFQPMRQALEIVCLGHGRTNMPFRVVITIVFLLVSYMAASSAKDMGMVMAFNGAIAGIFLAYTVPGWMLHEVRRSYGAEVHIGTSRWFTKKAGSTVAGIGMAMSIVSVLYLIFT